jgi:biotin synthesis protein BioG
MKTCWLHQQGNQDCLLFMAGWGMCPEPFQDIPAGGTDVLMVYDYRDMDTGGITSFLRSNTYRKYKTYKRLHLLAWSMGVWIASMLSRHDELFDSRLTTAIAIGGTCHPIHDKLGIPEQNFANMAEQLSPDGLEAFQRSMFTNKQEADRFTVFFCKGERSFEEVHQELLILATAYTTYTTDKVLSDVPNIYTSRLVTGRDQIFPARNQVRAWGRKQCSSLSLSHFPFYHWPSWSTMIEELKS